MAKRPGRAAAVGDSLMAHGGMVAVLNTIPGYSWDNHGVVGETSGRILARAGQWAVPTYNEVVILAGANDFPGMAASQTVGNLNRIVQAAKAAGQRVTIVTTTPWRGYSSWSSTAQARQDEVNNWIRRNSAGADVVVDAYPVLSDGTGRLIAQFAAPDGLHLNASGQRFLGNLIKREAF